MSKRDAGHLKERPVAAMEVKSGEFIMAGDNRRKFKLNAHTYAKQIDENKESVNIKIKNKTQNEAVLP